MPDIENMPMLHLLSVAARATERVWDEVLHPIGLSSAGATALKMLAVTGPGTQSALAEASGLRAQSLGETLVKLEALGCIKQLRQGRVKIVSLSDRGAQMLERIDEAERQVLARLGVDDRFRTELRGLVCTALI
ncbi:MarR family winged helix-turn-helix transcriptional regulator [Arthrobacter sp. ISL-95]|uniref:MarR family winged helix-turn-helix transcriptional regulator n=1 Tax=Arthrobacter sp. ISL-95 TaxID=2819116 RepID=UPI001BE72B2C|nr:MarR family transcriptional regulator [Arthrobacter sp. ISL-95]MBT2586519.1 MarR family transcriptional regulator [Arthrobacter sp. ISL-95]